MSDFHPETWVPAWSVASILNGVLSFMLESTVRACLHARARSYRAGRPLKHARIPRVPQPTVGSVEASAAERRRLARASFAFNRKVAIFRELFPQLVCHEADGEGDENVDDPAEEAPPGHGGSWISALALALAAAAAVAAAAVAWHASAAQPP